jgi:hypothetical protein
MDKHQVAMFRRAEQVELRGESINQAHLAQVSRLGALRTLTLMDTSLTPDVVRAWERNHPRVKVEYIPRQAVVAAALSANQPG